MLVVACGGKDKPPPKKPKPDAVAKPEPKQETEADREAKRREIAVGIIPDGTTCLPPALKGSDGPRLELSRLGDAPVVCAIDTDTSRLLGAVACWKVEDFAEGTLTYQASLAVPSRGMTVKLDAGCARGFCLPKDAKAGDFAHLALSDDGSKAVVVSGDDAHIFDATARSRESGFSIRGDKGATGEARGVHWVADTIFVHTAEGPKEHIFMFKVDGTAAGGIMSMEKEKKDQPVDIHGGAFSVLGKNKVLLVERGYAAAMVYEVDTGKRTRVVKKTTTAPCKAPEIEAYWTGGDDVGSKCKAQLTKEFAAYTGADAILGGTGANLLVMLRGARLGELAVVELKTLKEKSVFKLPWCDAPVADADAPKDEKKSTTRGAVKKDKGEEDPDQGGQ